MGLCGEFFLFFLFYFYLFLPHSFCLLRRGMKKDVLTYYRVLLYRRIGRLV